MAIPARAVGDKTSKAGGSGLCSLLFERAHYEKSLEATPRARMTMQLARIRLPAPDLPTLARAKNAESMGDAVRKLPEGHRSQIGRDALDAVDYLTGTRRELRNTPS